MKVYIVDTVGTYDDILMAHIYPKNRNFGVFPTFDKAFEFCIKDRCPDWDVDPMDIYTVKYHEDPSIYYIYEKGNEKTLNHCPDLWAVIIEAEVREE